MKYLLLALLTSLGCSRSAGEADTYARVAERVNPVLERLRPTAIRISSLDVKSPSTHAEIVELCKTMDPELEQLKREQADLGELGGAPGSADANLNVPIAARQIVLGRLGLCGDPTSLRLCAEYCHGRWSNLRSSVEQLNQRAAKFGVKFVELR